MHQTKPDRNRPPIKASFDLTFRQLRCSSLKTSKVDFCAPLSCCTVENCRTSCTSSTDQLATSVTRTLSLTLCYRHNFLSDSNWKIVLDIYGTKIARFLSGSRDEELCQSANLECIYSDLRPTLLRLIVGKISQPLALVM